MPAREGLTRSKPWPVHVLVTCDIPATLSEAAEVGRVQQLSQAGFCLHPTVAGMKAPLHHSPHANPHAVLCLQLSPLLLA